MNQDADSIKLNAIEFHRTVYLGNPAKAVADYVGAEYIQHNPLRYWKTGVYRIL